MSRVFKIALGMLVFVGTTTIAFAAEGASGLIPMEAIGAGIAIGIAAFGGAFGQGRAAAAALDGIARNPGASGKIFVPMIIGMALIESLVIYALIIAFKLVHIF